MAAEAEKRGLPAQLPVMAALVESNLTNVNFGDADSLGYFQMRVSFWESEYAGFADDPKKQIDWFLDTAERVKEQRLSRGQSITDPNQFGEWIADVERPAEQYRGRYQLQLDKANELLANAPKTPAAPEVAPAAAVAPVAPAAPIDPDQFGQDGTGGKPDAAAQALLENKNVVLDDVGVADIKAGRIDPRIVGVLTKLSQEHKIVVSCMCSDHSRMTAGGSVSNHAFGRGLDIASIDGEIVGPGSALAREVASELSQFDPALRPDEIGSPFAINGPGYFTDAAHSNHIHVGFKTEITPDFKLPADVAPAAAAPAAVAPRRRSRPSSRRPASPRAPAPDPKKASGLFGALPEKGKVAAAGEPHRPPATPSCSCRPSQAEKAAAAARSRSRLLPAAVDPAAVDLTGAPGGYPGDDAPKEQIAAWMAARPRSAGCPRNCP